MRIHFLPLLTVLGLAVGCQQSPAPDAKPLVIASFYPMYDFTRQVAGDRAQVVSLVPPGVHGHDWEPSPQDVARLRQARVFVYNGAGFEPWAEKVIAEAAGPSLVVVAASVGPRTTTLTWRAIPARCSAAWPAELPPPTTKTCWSANANISEREAP